jgi:hypothetical protein
MFGHHAAKRASNRLRKEQSQLNKQKSDWQNASPEREKEAMELQNKTVAEKAAQSAADRQAARESGRKDTEEFFKKDIQGLDPEKRKALQYEANKGIQRGVQSANRKLLGEQSKHGIVGKGGVGYAQQKDLQRLGIDAQNQANRDLTKLDSDLALKKLAAIYSGGEGHAATSGLDKQIALDELQLAEEKKRQRNFEDQFNRLFSRV